VLACIDYCAVTFLPTTGEKDIKSSKPFPTPGATGCAGAAGAASVEKSLKISSTFSLSLVDPLARGASLVGTGAAGATVASSKEVSIRLMVGGRW
jgi:hypothetical protein